MSRGMLSEKEIEQAIRDALVIPPDVWRPTVALDLAAHAIAERLREGVVFETKGAWLPPSATHKGILWIAGDEHSPAVVTGGLPTSMEGKEPVTVTVTKEE